MASDQPDAMDLDVTAQLRILILLDITGSMSGEIRAVKQASAELVRLSGEEFNDVQLAVAIITFTEEDGCGKVRRSCEATHGRSTASCLTSDTPCTLTERWPYSYSVRNFPCDISEFASASQLQQ